MAEAVESRFGGEVPVELADLVTLPGVGRKTGNVVRSVWFHEHGLPVDTHVTRLARRLRLTNEADPVKIQHDLGTPVPPGEEGGCAVQRTARGCERPLGREQLGRHGGVRCLAVALGQLGDAARELVDLGLDARQRREVARRAHAGECATPRRVLFREMPGWRPVRSVVPMLDIVDLRGIPGDLRAALARPAGTGNDVAQVVAEIIGAVRERGDDALRELTQRLDGCALDDLRVPPADLVDALSQLTPRLRSALELARDQIVAWHEAQREKEARHERLGIEVYERVIPVDRAGCYVPGGRAPLVSSVLMTALTARVAGVPEVVLCVPPGRDGRVASSILAAAELATVDE